MPTIKQQTGNYGELAVVRNCDCPRCGKYRTLKQLKNNFKCVDLICEFCGFLAQVKSSTAKKIDTLPKTILGAAWEPQKERMDAGIRFPLYLVRVTDDLKQNAIYYLAADHQPLNMFRPRCPLSPTARRAGWQGFNYDIDIVKDLFVRLV